MVGLSVSDGDYTIATIHHAVILVMCLRGLIRAIEMTWLKRVEVYEAEV
jgi:hypothetical protein